MFLVLKLSHRGSYQGKGDTDAKHGFFDRLGKFQRRKENEKIERGKEKEKIQRPQALDNFAKKA